MPSLRTCHNRRKHKLAREVYLAAYDFDLAYYRRLKRIGRLDKRANSGFVRRQLKRQRQLLKVSRAMSRSSKLIENTECEAST